MQRLVLLRSLSPRSLGGIVRGIEKEGLRARPDGSLALTPHPTGLGSALTHPHITTDFSESQLELITGVHTRAQACEDELVAIHQAVYRELGDELVWAASMPCRLPADEAAIPLGRYGSSNVGRAKTIYRNGLAHRYGRRMQTISGIHYNFSLPTQAWPELQAALGASGSLDGFRNAAYFGLIRNFRRHSWLLLYLFGASPAVSDSFVTGRAHALRPLAHDTLHLPHATSLRMGPLGYQSDAQSALAVSYNSLAGYAASLHRALTEPYAAYEAIGIGGGDDYRQLATTLLQIENEFYGTIRPKRRVRPGERPLHALGERGVEYVEVRCMDIDPFEAVGISASTMRFLDVFLLHCLLSDSPPDSPAEITELLANQHRMADRGREPDLALLRRGEAIGLRPWGEALLAECMPIAEALDRAQGGAGHRDAVQAAERALREPASLPSARVLDVLAARHRNSFIDFGLSASMAHRDTLVGRAADPAAAARLAALAHDSIGEQASLEASDAESFEQYRKRYLEQPLLEGEQFRLPA